MAVTRWARRSAVSPQWAGAGIRLKVLAPGVIATPLLDEQIAQGETDAVEQLAVPIGGRGNSRDVGEWVSLMLSQAADFPCGSVIFVDRGSDVYFRTDDWSACTSPPGVMRCLRRVEAWREQY